MQSVLAGRYRSGSDFCPGPYSNLVEELEQQVKVSKMLGLAFALSITTIAGIGSLFALILGLKALRIIHNSNGRITGRLMAWWCILAGALGTLIIPPMIVALILKASI